MTAGVMNLNGTFETGITGWAGNNATLVQSSTQKRSGGFSMRLTANSAANMSADTPSGTSGFRVHPSSAYIAWAFFRAVSTVRSCRVDVDWYTGAGAFISTSSTTTISDSNSAWTRTSNMLTSPATAAFARVRTFVLSPANGEQHYVDDAMLGTVRAVGFVDEWPVDWDGVDSQAYATVTASGRLARFAGGVELRSVIEEEYLLDSPLAYYPFGEASGSTGAADVSGNGPILTRGGTGSAPTFGSATGPGTDGLTSVTFAANGKYLTAPAGLTLTGSSLVFECFFNLASDSPTNLLQLGDVDSNGPKFQVVVGAAGAFDYSAVATDAGGDQLVCQATGLTFGQTYHLAFHVSGTSATLYLDGTSIATDTNAAYAFPAQTLSPLTIGLTNSSAVTVAHAALFASLTAARTAAHSDAGSTGFAGETPAARLARYLGYAGVPTSAQALDTGVAAIAHVDITGKTAEQACRIVETTDAGVLFDGRDGSVTYHDRDHRYGTASAVTLDAAAQELGAAFRPVLDRQQIINDATAKNTTDTLSARVVDSASVTANGPARTELELATDDPEEPLQAAAWRVNRYSTPHVRVPALAPVDVLPLAADKLAALVVATVGTKLTASNLPAQAPASTSSYYIEGWREAIAPESWTFEFDVSAATLSDAWVLDSATLSQLGTTTVLGY